VTRQRWGICFSYFNLSCAIGALVGSLVGGMFSSLDISLGFSSIILLFFISFLSRAIVFRKFIRSFSEKEEFRKN
jgi:hypothetical protein